MEGDVTQFVLVIEWVEWVSKSVLLPCAACHSSYHSLEGRGKKSSMYGFILGKLDYTKCVAFIFHMLANSSISPWNSSPLKVKWKLLGWYWWKWLACGPYWMEILQYCFPFKDLKYITPAYTLAKPSGTVKTAASLCFPQDQRVSHKLLWACAVH